MEMQTISSGFQQAIETVENLPADDQMLLIKIIKQRLIQHRRYELITAVAEAREAYRTGITHQGSVEDLLQELEELDD